MIMQTFDKFNSADLDKVKGNVKAVCLDGYKISQERPTVKVFLWSDKRERCWGFVEETGENVIPYFDTGLYINLDTMNLISKGERNSLNLIIMPLVLYTEKKGIIISRDRIVSALERYCLGYPINKCFLVDESAGSLVSRSLGKFSDEALYQQMIENVYRFRNFYSDACWESRELFDIDTFQKGGFVEVRLSAFISMMRSSNSDYVFRSCIEFPQYWDVLIQKLGIEDIDSRLRDCVAKTLYGGKYKLEKNKTSEFSEDSVDLSRIFKRVKEVVK